MPFTKQHSACAWVVTCILFLINLTFHNLSLHSSYTIHQPFTDYFLRLPYSEQLEKRLFRSRANRRLVLTPPPYISPDSWQAIGVLTSLKWGSPVANFWAQGAVQGAVQTAVAKSGKGAVQGALQGAVQTAVAKSGKGAVQGAVGCCPDCGGEDWQRCCAGCCPDCGGEVWPSCCAGCCGVLSRLRWRSLAKVLCRVLCRVLSRLLWRSLAKVL